ncbi:hypothetical protein IQ07DRAFT_248717 [Pyrenochaeta sp. DS3sAY3a]|nr:hypothetical protein IQ07DRAFT_248717 [Pyrenochaeta sp. DS3sAY3a]
MTSPAPAPTPDRPVLDTDASATQDLFGRHERTDTLSSVGSAKTLPKGNWKLNLSGNCPACHHHHSSVTVHIRALNDSNHVGDISCDHCEELWLGFGKRTSTRTSLLSDATIEPAPLVSDFRAAIIEMMRSATAAALSPTLTDIPEASSAGPSRETSVRSTSRSIAKELSPIADGPTSPLPKDLPTQINEPRSAGFAPPPSGQIDTPPSNSQRPRSTKFLLRIKKKFGKWQKSILGRPSSESVELSLNQQGKQPITKPTLVISTACDIAPETQPSISNEPKLNSIDVCTPSSSAKEALDSLTRIDRGAIQALTPEERDKWGREQITAFKTKYSKPTLPLQARTGSMVDIGTQANLDDLLPYVDGPPTRRHSFLAHFGGAFGNDYWHIFRGSNLTLARPLSVSETPLSEADTAVEGVSDSPIPRHMLRESLHRSRRGSGSPRPRSLHSFVQQARSSRVENRRSLDSNAVRSITSGRGRTINRSSLARSSQTQLALPTNEVSDLSNGQEQEHLNSGPPSSSPSPPLS